MKTRLSSIDHPLKMKEQTAENSRRKFLAKAAMATVAGSSAMLIPFDSAAVSRNKVAPSDQVNVAFMGVKGIGWNNLQSMVKVPGVNITTLCDIDDSVLAERNQGLEKLTGKKAKEMKDYRRVLEMKDIDAVVISTPDHWHALPFLDACMAGKDVYIEKPLANTIEECNLMVKATRQYNRVVQVGQQQRSGPHWSDAMQYVQSGKLGKIRTVKAWVYIDWKGAVPHVPDGPVPPGVDYDMWLGPAPLKPFNMNRFHFTFRWFWDYAGGLMTDWGVHLIDIALWGMNAGGPKSVMASGGKYAFPDDAMETPDTMYATYEFGDFLMQWEHTIGLGRGPYDRRHGIAFIGENATLVVARDGWEVIPEYDRTDPQLVRYKTPLVPMQRPRGDDRDLHTNNFIQCIRNRQDPICNIETGANVAINAQLGNIAYRLGRKVYWDDQQKRFVNDPEAEALAKTNYRAPWKLPKIS
jgi:predicted dehydrogenase